MIASRFLDGGAVFGEEGRPEGRPAIPLLTQGGARMMSPTRPEREEDTRPPSVPDRPADRATPVSGAAEVQARLDLHLSQCRRRGGVLALLCVSVDAVSLTDGEAGANLEQRVRQEVSNRIGNAVRASDAILRESDRDTCVVLPGADAAVAGRVGRRLERLVNGDYRVAGKLLQVAVHIGTAMHPQDGLRAAELLRKAGERG
ncbi:MAG: diguanylate cyclase domain-containing protein [Vitreoscilla sp.]